MTNNWSDLGFSTCFIVQGANPVENHPASIAHLNSARYDANSRGRNAALVVIDPRQTRTARMLSAPQIIAAAKTAWDAAKAAWDPAAVPPKLPSNDMRWLDRYVRIRPGTNIAFNNGILNAIIAWMYDKKGSGGYDGAIADNFFAWHNATAPGSTASRTFINDTGGTGTVTIPKYCDSRILVNAAGDDYQRTTQALSSGSASNFPLFAANVDDPDCVFQKIVDHVAPYDLATVADICGCLTSDIEAVRDAYIYTSRFASSDFGATAMTQTAAGYRAACIMYAMGATQFTTGSQGIRGYAQIQTMMGNMGRCGGGINALRGIHNVQGSTDMGVLFDLIPGYSGNPSVSQSYADYSNKLFGNRVLNGTSPVTTGAKDPYVAANLGLQQRGFYNMTREWFGSRALSTQAEFDAMYACWPKGNGVQHIEAFRRMDPAWIAVNGGQRIHALVNWGQNPAITEPNQGAVRTGLYELDLLVCVDLLANETAMADRKTGGKTYLLPSCSHVEEAGSVSSSGRWIQWRDRAIAPVGNSKADLELLLRLAKKLSDKGAFGHIQAQWAGTVLAGQDPYTVLYGKYGWDPAGATAFEDIALPDAEGLTLQGSEYVAEQIFKEMCSPLNATSGVQGTLWIYSGNGSAGAYNASYKGDVDPALSASIRNVVVTDTTGTTTYTNNTDYTYDANTGEIKRVATGAITDGQEVHVDYEYGFAYTSWTAVTNESVVLTGTTAVTLAYKALAPAWTQWTKANRAKSRNGDRVAHAGVSGQYSRYGWAWLLNRRIFYNNGELTGDVADVFVAPGFMARLFTINTNTLADWSTLYRAYNTLADMPDAGIGDPHVHPGRLPAYVEPYESPRPDLVATWGQNTANGSPLVMSSTPRGVVADYPLVLTSIRCVEHFQGGPITRNNPWNVDCEPEPWIELNSVDAATYGIADGDYVNVITARGNSTTDQEGRTGDLITPGWAKGFKARVGVGTLANQRVAPGVVAIPWHWGERGLGTGSRANDLCIDSWDANTRIPEFKACLCKIEKA